VPIEVQFSTPPPAIKEGGNVQIRWRNQWPKGVHFGIENATIKPIQAEPGERTIRSEDQESLLRGQIRTCARKFFLDGDEFARPRRIPPAIHKGSPAELGLSELNQTILEGMDIFMEGGDTTAPLQSYTHPHRTSDSPNGKLICAAAQCLRPASITLTANSFCYPNFSH
jgi:hypothetical protein